MNPIEQNFQITITNNLIESLPQTIPESTEVSLHDEPSLHLLTNEEIEPHSISTKKIDNAADLIKSQTPQKAHTEVKLSDQPCQDLITNAVLESQPVTTKNTVDAAVQTEILPTLQINQPTTTTPASPLTPPQNVQKSLNITVLSSNTQNRTITSQCKPSFNKERRLIRNTTNPTMINNNSNASNTNLEKKHFRWRRKRNISKTQENISQCQTLDKSQHDINKEISNADVKAVSAQPSERNQDQGHQVIESLNQAINTSGADITEDSETSSIVHRNTNEKLVIEETSTSGVISNTTSHADSEWDSVKQHDVTFNAKEMRENIMFDVVNRSMEQNLRTKCDEWVSTYVQIMEEALTQFLQENHRMLRNVMPPPWTLYEASHCIKILFTANRDVVNASNQLLDVLNSISDRGNFILLSCVA